jgi:hypothetical protein
MAGAGVCAVSLVGISLPLMFALGQAAKYVVAPAFVGMCIGLSLLLNGAIDWWRAR